MKKILCLLILVLCYTSGFSQMPEKFNYQAVIRDASGNIRSDVNITLQIEILQGSATGSSIYVERHDVKTNSWGLVNIDLGGGIVEVGTFNTINWAAGPYFILVKVDGVKYGVTQVLSVPLALYAKKAGNGFSGDYNDLTNRPTTMREVTDEFNAAVGQTNFTLTQTPSTSSKVKMYINGVRISNKAYSTNSNILTYIPSNNGAYVLAGDDRIQFDYSY